MVIDATKTKNPDYTVSEESANVETSTYAGYQYSLNFENIYNLASRITSFFSSTAHSIINFFLEEKETTSLEEVFVKKPQEKVTKKESEESFKATVIKEIDESMKLQDSKEALIKLRTIARNLLGRKVSNDYRASKKRELYGLFIEQVPNTEKIGSLLKDLVDSFAKKGKAKGREEEYKENEFWNPNGKVNPETLVDITHGGGLQYILDCFENKEEGYNLELGGLGIQVHPDAPECRISKYNNRPCHYAERQMPLRLDFPAILTGKIKAKHLLPAWNSYEAGIRIPSLKYIENPKIILCAESDDIKNNKELARGSTNIFDEITAFNRFLPRELRKRMEEFNNKTPTTPSAPITC